MKKWKRLFSLVCAFAMIFSLNTTAFAAELPKTDTKQQYEITVGVRCNSHLFPDTFQNTIITFVKIFNIRK